jgi:hypothetical protein
MSFTTELVKDASEVSNYSRVSSLLESNQIKEAARVTEALDPSLEKSELERRISDLIKSKIDAINFITDEEFDDLAKIAHLIPLKDDRISAIEELALKLLFYMREEIALEKVVELALRSRDPEEESILLSKICYLILDENSGDALRIANMIKNEDLKVSVIGDIEIALEKKKK